MEPNSTGQYNSQAGGQPPQPPYPPQPVVDDDTKTLGILSLVFAFLFSIAGLIIGIVGKVKAQKVQKSTGRDAEGSGLLTAGIVCSIVMMVLPIIFAILVFIGVLQFSTAIISTIDSVDWSDSSSSTVESEDEDYADIIIGKWDCGDGTSSISGYIFDDEGNIIGHDGSVQNPDISRRYEFSSNGRVYAYETGAQYSNYLRASYTSELVEVESNGMYEYQLTIKFTSFVADGENLEDYVGREAAWNVVVSPDDKDTMALGMAGGTGSAFLCERI